MVSLLLSCILRRNSYSWTWRSTCTWRPTTPQSPCWTRLTSTAWSSSPTWTCCSLEWSLRCGLWSPSRWISLCTVCSCTISVSFLLWFYSWRWHLTLDGCVFNREWRIRRTESVGVAGSDWYSVPTVLHRCVERSSGHPPAQTRYCDEVWIGQLISTMCCCE